jgi:hypothetical protein
MFESELQKMYQAWMQGNQNYIRDWSIFVERAAKWNNTTGDVIMRELQKYSWFERGDE